MTERKEKRTGGIQRYFIASHRTSSLRVITLDQLDRTQHLVRIVDLSVVGVGIELNEWIDPGLVCFEDQVGGHRFGLVTWCRQSGDGYRAGISFMTLPQEKEKYILRQVKLARFNKSLQDPAKIIANLLESIKRERNG